MWPKSLRFNLRNFLWTQLSYLIKNDVFLAIIMYKVFAETSSLFPFQILGNDRVFYYFNLAWL